MTAQRPVIVPAQRTETAASLVGRETELSLLRAVFARTVERRRPHLVTITGDPGIGKSRMVADFERSLVDAAVYVHFRCMRSAAGPTFGPLVQSLARLADLRESDTPDVAHGKLRHFVNRSGVADPEQVVAALATACSIGLSDESRDVPRELGHAWSALLNAVVEQPVVLVVEDAQWAEPVLLATLEEAVKRVETPLLVICVARPEYASNQALKGLNQTSMVLDPLTELESERLIRQLTSKQPLDARNLSIAISRATGNPLCLEQFVLAVVEGTEVGSGDAPEFMAKLIRLRLASLERDHLQVLQEAAVAGPTFWSGHLGVGLSAPDVTHALQALQQHSLVWRRPSTIVPGEAEYAFHHELIREVAYDSMSSAQRGVAHAAFARWLERTFPHRMEARSAELAHHFVCACAGTGDDESRAAARRYSLLAADVAYKENAVRKAATFAEHAISMSRSATDRVECYESLGDLYQVGNGAWRAYVAALGELRVLEPDSSSMAARIAAKASLVATRWRESMQDVPRDEELEEVINVGLEAATDYDENLVYLLVSKALLEASRPGPISLDGVACADEAVRIAEELDRPDLLSEALVAGARVRPDDYRSD